MVDARNQKRVSRFITLVSSFLPIPALGLVLHGTVSLGQMALTYLTQYAVQKRDTGKYGQQLGEIETIDQAAELVLALVEVFVRRFQWVFAQLRPESLEVFVGRVVTRMVDYGELVADKLKTPEDRARWLSQGLVNLMQSLPSSEQASIQTNVELTRSQQFDYFIENMVIGSSLWDDTPSISEFSGDTGTVAGIASFMMGDREVSYQSTYGFQSAKVQQICRNAPIITSKIGSLENKPTYHYVRLADSKSLPPEQSDMPPLYLSEAECQLRGGYRLGARVALEVPIPPKAFMASPEQRIIQLQQQLEAERARADREKARADAAEAQLAALQSNQLVPEESKPSISSQSDGRMRMFDHKPTASTVSTLASSQVNVSRSDNPSSSTSSASSLGFSGS